MRLLLDTHALLWALAGDPRLRPEASAAIADRANAVYASAASAWEMAIKVALGVKTTTTSTTTTTTTQQGAETTKS